METSEQPLPLLADWGACSCSYSACCPYCLSPGHLTEQLPGAMPPASLGKAPGVGSGVGQLFSLGE